MPTRVHSDRPERRSRRISCFGVPIPSRLIGVRFMTWASRGSPTRSRPPSCSTMMLAHPRVVDHRTQYPSVQGLGNRVTALVQHETRIGRSHTGVAEGASSVRPELAPEHSVRRFPCCEHPNREERPCVRDENYRPPLENDHVAVPLGETGPALVDVRQVRWLQPEPALRAGGASDDHQSRGEHGEVLLKNRPPGIRLRVTLDVAVTPVQSSRVSAATAPSPRTFGACRRAPQTR